MPTLPARVWPGGFELRSQAFTPATFADVDCVAILTDHTALDYDALVAHAAVIVDTRNALKGAQQKVFRLGAPRPADRPLESSSLAGATVAV